jgi:hypothetical protein
MTREEAMALITAYDNACAETEKRPDSKSIRLALAAISDTAPAAPASTERLRELARLLEQIRDTADMPIDWYRSRAEEANTALVLAVAGIAPAPVVAPTTGPHDSETVAKLFHEQYERLAPSYGWKTNPSSACAWENLPHANRELMVHVVNVVLDAIGYSRPAAPTTGPAGRRLRHNTDVLNAILRAVAGMPPYTGDQVTASAVIADAIEARDAAWLGILEALRGDLRQWLESREGR